MSEANKVAGVRDLTKPKFFDDRKMRDKLVKGMKLDSEDMLIFLELVSETSWRFIQKHAGDS